MTQFNFNQAYDAIVKASIEQDIKEIPLLLDSVDFSGKECLEIGAGPFARLAVKLLKSKTPPKHITCLDPWNLEKIRQVAEREGIGEEISVVKPKDPLKLPFDKNSFDIVYAGWIPSDLLRNKDYLGELARVSKKDVVLIMSGLEGDIPKMREFILGGDESWGREELRASLVDYFQKKGYNVDTSGETTLRLDFSDLDTIFNTFHFFDFKNDLLTEGLEKLREYLSPRIHDFKNNLYVFHAWRD